MMANCTGTFHAHLLFLLLFGGFMWVPVCGIINGVDVIDSMGEYSFIGGLYSPRKLQKPLLWCHFVWWWNCQESNQYRLFASAVLVHPRWALTAAHALMKPGSTTRLKDITQLRLGFGSTNRLLHSFHQIERVIIHPNYHRDDAGNLYNDVALVRLADNVTSGVEPIGLPDSNGCDRVQKQLAVLGWGVTAKRVKSLILQRTKLAVYPTKQCLRHFGIEKKWKNKKKSAGWLCTYSPKTDACWGDSGGPLLAEGAPRGNQTTSVKCLIALVSFGKGCATKRPAINTKVQPYVRWIEDTIRTT